MIQFLKYLPYTSYSVFLIRADHGGVALHQLGGDVPDGVGKLKYQGISGIVSADGGGIRFGVKVLLLGELDQVIEVPHGETVGGRSLIQHIKCFINNARCRKNAR